MRGSRPEFVYWVPVMLATAVPFRWMRYPVTAVSSVEGCHLRDTWDEVTVGVERLPGVLGAFLSEVTQEPVVKD